MPLGGVAEGSQSLLQERGGQPSEGWTGWTSAPDLKTSIYTMRSGPAPHSPGGIQRGRAPRDPWSGRGPRAPLLRLGTLPTSDDPRRTDRDEPPAPVRRTPTSPLARHLKGVGPHAVELRGTEHLDGPQGAGALDDDHVEAVGVLGEVAHGPGHELDPVGSGWSTGSRWRVRSRRNRGVGMVGLPVLRGG